jgi:N utilization substance protein A
VAKLRYSTDDLKNIAFFETQTKSKVVDFIRSNDVLCFVVAKGDMGLAIGKGGSKIEKIRKSMKKPIIVFEFDEVAEEFLKNMFHPIEIHGLEVAQTSGEKIALVQIAFEDRPRAVGKKNNRLKLMKELVERHFQIDDIRVKAV